MSYSANVEQDLHVSSPVDFSRLLVLLGREHAREIDKLENEVKLPREQLQANIGKVKTDSDLAFAITPREDICSPKPLDVSPPLLRPPDVTTSEGDGSAKVAAIKTDSTNADTVMHWHLQDIPEEVFMTSQFVEYFLKTRLGRAFGLTREYVDDFKIWWRDLREPDRPSYCGVRDLVDGIYFQACIIFVIFLNTIYIFYTTEVDIQRIQDDPGHYHSLDSKKTRLYCDLVFTFIYSVELVMKLLVHRSFFFFGETCGWNIFDFVLVVFSVFDNSLTIIFLEEKIDRPNLSFLRALRMLRITRIMRLIRAVAWVQELRLMLDCVVHSVFHLFWCVLLIVLVLIVFALLLVQGLTHQLAAKHSENSLTEYEKSKEAIQGFFDSVPHAMLSLFKATTGGEDWQDFYVVCAEAGGFYEAVFLFYIAFFCIVAWNIVMSTFVEKVLKLSVPDANLIILEKRKKDLIYSKELTEIIQARLGAKTTMSIKDFRELVDDPELNLWLQARDFDMKDAETFFQMLAAGHQHHEVDIHTFVLGCMRLQGTASNLDLQALHFDLRSLHTKQHLDFKHFSRELLAHVRKETDRESASTPRPDTIRDAKVEILV